jgi:hypothetical protein
MSDSTKLRQVATGHGRVYQMYEGSSMVRIDWTPPTPVHGHRQLTSGKIQAHPTEGKIVTFGQTVGGGRKEQTLSARLTPDRGTLAELVGLAEAMESELLAEAKEETERHNAEHAAKLEADLEAFTATLPAGYIAIESVKHEPGAADGWGMTTYRHGGFELTWKEIGEMDSRRHHPLGNPYQLLVYVPGAGLDALLERKRIEELARADARATRIATKEADRAARISLARETGKPVELERWTEGCYGSADECSTDILYRMVRPDGTIVVNRIHTH